MLCQEVAPAFAVFRIPGLVQDRSEESYVQTRLFPTLREQARAHGMVLLTTGSLGTDVVLSRVPIDSMDTLRRLKLWQWDLDRTSVVFTRAMGLHPVPLPVTDAGKRLRERRHRRLHRGAERGVRVPVVLAAGLHVAAAVRAAARLRGHDHDGVRSPAAGSARRDRDGVGEVRAAHRGDHARAGRGAARRAVRASRACARCRCRRSCARSSSTRRTRRATSWATQLVPTELLMKVQSFLADYRSMHH